MTVALSAAALFLVACGPGLKAPKTSDGSKIGLYIVYDRNLPADGEAEILAQRTQMSEYLEADLNKLLPKYGYEVFPIAAADQFNPGPNKFLMNVKVVDYDPGKAGARVARALMGGFVGRSIAKAGGSKISVEYTLSGEQGKVASADYNLAAKDWKWQNLIRDLNLAVLKSTSKSLQALYK